MQYRSKNRPLIVWKRSGFHPIRSVVQPACRVSSVWRPSYYLICQIVLVRSSTRTLTVQQRQQCTHVWIYTHFCVEYRVHTQKLLVSSNFGMSMLRSLSYRWMVARSPSPVISVSSSLISLVGEARLAPRFYLTIYSRPPTCQIVVLRSTRTLRYYNDTTVVRYSGSVSYHTPNFEISNKFRKVHQISKYRTVWKYRRFWYIVSSAGRSPYFLHWYQVPNIRHLLLNTW